MMAGHSTVWHRAQPPCLSDQTPFAESVDGVTGQRLFEIARLDNVGMDQRINGKTEQRRRNDNDRLPQLFETPEQHALVPRRHARYSTLILNSLMTFAHC